MEEVTTKQLDEAVKKLWDRRVDYDSKKKNSNDALALVDEAELELISLLEQCEKTSYNLEGVAKITKVTKLSVQTPKELDQKAKFFKWLKDRFGAEGFLAYLNINSNSLQALYNSEYEAAEDKVLFHIDGIEAPTERVSLRMNKL